MGEPRRYALNSLVRIAPKWLQGRVPTAWDKRYGARFEPYRLPQTERERAPLTRHIGQDGQPLRSWVDGAASPAPLQHCPGVDILRQGGVQQDSLEPDQRFWPQPDHRPATEPVIHSPDDPEARSSQQRETEWLGYNAHVTETCADEQPPRSTPVATTLATTQAAQLTTTLHPRVAAHALWPQEHLLDRGYVDTNVLMDSQPRHGVEVGGPITVHTTWQAQSGKGFDVAGVHIAGEPQRGSCPPGQVRQVWAHRQDQAGNPSLYVRLATRSGQVCPGRTAGTRSAKGPRIWRFKPQEPYELLQWARQREQTAEVTARDAKRAGIEGTIAHGTRAFCLRRSRSIGHTNTHLQHMLIAVAINLARVVAWINGEALAKTRTSPVAPLAPAAS